MRVDDDNFSYMPGDADTHAQPLLAKHLLGRRNIRGSIPNLDLGLLDRGEIAPFGSRPSAERAPGPIRRIGATHSSLNHFRVPPLSIDHSTFTRARIPGNHAELGKVPV